MTCAQLEPSRVERLVLVDLAGSPDGRAAVPVVASVSRLGIVYPSAQAAIALIKQIGIHSRVGRVLGSLLPVRAARRRHRRDAEQRPRRGAFLQRAETALQHQSLT
jgi:hypothetical protein